MNNLKDNLKSITRHHFEAERYIFKMFKRYMPNLKCRTSKQQKNSKGDRKKQITLNRKENFRLWAKYDRKIGEISAKKLLKACSCLVTVMFFSKFGLVPSKIVFYW